MQENSTVRCPRCFAQNPPLAVYCLKCGCKIKADAEEGKEKERAKKEQHVNYFHEGQLYESILTNDGLAGFLTYRDDEGFKIVRDITVVDDVGQSVMIQPSAPKILPYRQYVVGGLDKPVNLSALWEEVFTFIKRRVVAPTEYLKLLTFDIFLTYFQECFEAIHYLYLVGDTESGKTRVLDVLNMLCFRALQSVDMPAADIYEYLGKNSNLCRGIILEDEAEDIVKDTDKRRIWKCGYKRGALVPRIITVERTGERKQQFYNSYCFKAAAAESLPYGRKAKGLLERCIILNMLHGIPERKELSEEDWEEAQVIRFELLKARLMFFGKIKPEGDFTVPIKINGEMKIIRLKGRDRELFAPILAVGALTGRLEEAEEAVSYFLSQRLKAKIQALEYYMAKALTKLVEDEERMKGSAVDYIDFTPSEGFEALKETVEGEIDETGEVIKSPFLEGRISKDYFGKRLKDVFKGERLVSKRGDRSIRVWRIKVENVKAALSKYEWLEEAEEISEIQASLPLFGKIQAPIEKATRIQAQATSSTSLPLIISGPSTPVTSKLPTESESRLVIKEEKEEGTLTTTSREVEEVASQRIEPLPEKEARTPVAFAEAPKTGLLEEIVRRREQMLRWCEAYNLAFFDLSRRFLLGEIRSFSFMNDVDPLASHILVNEGLRRRIQAEMDKIKGLPTVFEPRIRGERKGEAVIISFGISTDDKILTRFNDMLTAYLESERRRQQLYKTPPLKAALLTSRLYPLDKCYFCSGQPITAQLDFENGDWILVCKKCLDYFKLRFNFPIEEVGGWRERKAKPS